MLYFDHAATTPLLPTVKARMQAVATQLFANPSALHTPGRLAHQNITGTRQLLAKILHVKPDELIFTSGSSEANNTVIHTFAQQPIAASAIEHHSILAPLQAYAQPPILLPVDKNGMVCYNKKIWVQRPKLISISLANNEFGALQPLSTWTKAAHQYHAYIHSDLTQALGKIPLNLQKLNLDYATFSAHKIGGPAGVGVIYVRQGAPFTPLILGGDQEQGRRAGTYNTLAIAGFAAALQHLQDQHTPQLYAEHIRPLRDQLAERILNTIPGSSLNTPLNQACLPHILNVSFATAEGESIQLYLDAHDIIVSTGSACASGSIEPSHVLMAKTGSAEVAHSSIRFSFGLEHNAQNIDQLMSVLPQIVHRLQQISTLKLETTT